MKHDRKISKFLSLVLRHKPETIGIQLDESGWVDVDTLLNKLRPRFPFMDRTILERVVAENDKQRFRFDPSGARIRANQGHSLDIELDLAPLEPPATLLHGTVAKFLDAIRREGLIKGSRQHVHLSDNQQTAENVGARRGKPILLRVDAARMHAEGHLFFRSDNGVWLTDHVPPEYLVFSD